MKILGFKRISKTKYYYVYYLEISSYKDFYKLDFIDTINSIASSFGYKRTSSPYPTDGYFHLIVQYNRTLNKAIRIGISKSNADYYKISVLITFSFN